MKLSKICVESKLDLYNNINLDKIRTIIDQSAEKIGVSRVYHNMEYTDNLSVGEVLILYTGLTDIHGNSIRNLRNYLEIKGFTNFNEKSDIYSNTDISKIGLNTRSINILRKIGINTIGELSGVPYKELRRRGVGKESADLIMARLKIYNISPNDRQDNLASQDKQDNLDENYIKEKLASIDGEILEEQIDFTGTFSTRTSTILRIYGIDTVGELLAKTDDELMRMRNFGEKGLSEIKNWKNKFLNPVAEHEETENKGKFTEGKNTDKEGESALEKIKRKKVELEGHLRQLEEQTRQARELLAAYEQIIETEKTNEDTPNFKDE